MATIVYDFNQYTVEFAGITVTGFAPDTGIMVERNAPVFVTKKGVDGVTTREATNDDSAKITFTLAGKSPTNPKFSALLELDKSTPGGAGIAELFIRDRSGTTVHKAQEAWISTPPNEELGSSLGNSVWVLETGKIESFFGS